MPGVTGTENTLWRWTRNWKWPPSARRRSGSSRRDSGDTPSAGDLSRRLSGSKKPLPKSRRSRAKTNSSLPKGRPRCRRDSPRARARRQLVGRDRHGGQQCHGTKTGVFDVAWGIVRRNPRTLSDASAGRRGCTLARHGTYPRADPAWSKNCNFSINPCGYCTDLLRSYSTSS